MLIVSFLGLGVFLVVLQTTLLQFTPESFGRPDFVFLLVVFAAYRFAWLPGIVLTFTVSWIIDVLTSYYLGIYPLQCLLVFACLKGITTNIPIKESVYQIPLVGIGYFCMHLLVYCATSLLLPDALPEWLWGRILRETLLLVVVAVPCFLVFNGLYEYMQKRALRPRSARKQPARRR
jgi:rod shape-determining protein MreD